MMAPIFLIVALAILGLSKIAVTAVGRLTGLRAWAAAMALTVFICTIDHVIGYVYARVWVTLAKTSEVPTLFTNSIAYQYWEHPWQKTWYDSLGDRNHDPWPPNTPQEFYAGYLAWELGEGFEAVQGFAKNFTNDSTPRSMFEARPSTDPKDPACNWFNNLRQSKGTWNEDVERKKDWHQNMKKNWESGERAACPTLRPISKLTARYLIQNFYNLPPSWYEHAFGVRTLGVRRIVELEHNQTIAESRTIRFDGGWAARFLTIGYEYGFGHLFSASFRTEAKLPTVLPATRSRVE